MSRSPAVKPSGRQAVKQFLAARFDRAGYLGLHLTIGLAVTVLALWLFAGLTEDVVNAEAITQLDLTVNTWVRAHASLTGYGVFGALTMLGSPISLAVIGLAGAIVLGLRKRTVVLVGWIGAFAGGALLDTALKILVHRPRPPRAMDYLVRQSFSYPSGHAMMSLVAFGILAYVLCVMRWHRPAERTLTVVLALILILLVGTSRIYLGVHYLSDVLAGFIAGLVWLTACVSGLEVVRRGAIPPRPSGGIPATR